MITAVSCVPVPKITVVLAGSHGAGNYAMCGPAYDPRFTFLWPNAKISVMGGAQAAGVMTYIKNKSRARQGKPPMTPEQIEAIKGPIVEAFEANCSAYHSTAELYDDGVIDPRSTRNVLARCLSVTRNAPYGVGNIDTNYGVYRM